MLHDLQLDLDLILLATSIPPSRRRLVRRA